MRLFSLSESVLVGLSSSAWRYESWLNAYPLNRSTVLDYFKNSPFYSIQCNNERNQNQTNKQQQHNNQQRLQYMIGIEYEVESASIAATTATSTSTTPTSSPISSLNPLFDPLYFLIKKCYRFGVNDVALLCLYYVIGCDPPINSTQSAASLPRGTVIPLPTFQQVATYSIQTTTYAINQAIQHYQHYKQQQQQMQHEDEDDGDDEEDDGDDEHPSISEEDSVSASESESVIVSSSVSNYRHFYSALVDDSIHRVFK